jgi:5-methylcytosine-specific restriction endonuclease McrA
LDGIAKIMELYETAVGQGQVKRAVYWRHRMVEYLVERDGGRCQVCRRKVDVTLPSGPRGNKMGPSIDHVVPRSRGGESDYANLRLTHWKCNRSRGNRGGGEQLRLVG